MTPKQQAPPPPTGGFTGYVPSPTPREKLSAWRQRRQQAKASRPRGPMIQINTGPAQSSSTSRRRRGGPRGHTYSRRRRPKRGTLFAMLTVAVATVAVTATVIEFTAWETASELFTLAECISFGTAWLFGEPPAPKPAMAPKPANMLKNKRRQPAAQQGSGGHKCGAPTQDGSPCNRPVKNAADNCWEHPGGKGNPKAKTAGSPAAKPAGPKKTKKAAPPPSAPTP